MKGHVRDARTRMMMEVALQHARAAFETSCASKAPLACMIYEGSVWNAGAHVTVLVDRCMCEAHAACRPVVEAWLYDITGASVVYLGKQEDPRNRDIPAVPGDVPGSSPPAKPFLKD